MLCASAYAKRDANLVGCYINKCFRWGYFTKVEDIDIDKIIKSKPTKMHMMWCARFLDWKHPELPVLLAYNLKKKGYNFKLNMFGSGEMMDKTKELADKLDVLDVLKFRGNLKNDLIIEEMRSHHIFLFTSDRYEGWGAVLNESMSNGCAVIASNEIGAAPYLIEDGKNGLIFKSKDLESLISKTEYLLNNKVEMENMARNAYITLKEKWSPRIAAQNFMKVVECIQNNRLDQMPIYEGPCSLDK
jgi:glycosyltransferase involved in cell wall biosynthesis